MGHSLNGPDKYTTQGFLELLDDVNKRQKDRAFAFILGAGASVNSGIPAARELALTWLQELQRFKDSEYPNRSIEEWSMSGELQIPKFNIKQIEEFYTNLYDLRFAHDEDAGQAFLESIMSREEVSPSVGYSILAQILAGGRHSVVITTNFDHLVSDALLLFTNKEPFVVGHEELVSFIRPKMRRPLIAKIHRDLLLNPKNASKDLKKLHEAWSEALKDLFKLYTPIVIGYGGNDGTLMGLLEELSSDDITGRMIWCYREKDPIRKNVTETLEKLGGILLPILGFDEIMLQIGQRFELPVVAQQLEVVARQRGRKLLKQLGGIRRWLQSTEHKEALEVIKAIDKSINYQVEKFPDWWAWELKANAEPDLGLRAAIYEEATFMFNSSPELAAGFAKALLAQKDKKRAKKMMEHAYKLDRNFCYDLALLLAETNQADREYIEQLFEEALNIYPNNPEVYSDFAEYTGSSERATELFEYALEIDPIRIDTLINYALFNITQGRLNKARDLARSVWSLSIKGDKYNTARATLIFAIIAYNNGKNDQQALARIKAIISNDYEPPSDLDSNWLPTFISIPQHEDIAKAIADPDKLSILEQDQYWNEIEPIAPDIPWPEEIESDETA